MEIPVINLAEMEIGDGEQRSRAMSRFHGVCRNWGFFWVENHGVDVALMEKVKRLVYSHYDKHLKESFYNSELARGLGPQTNAGGVDWETTYFVQHQPVSNSEKFIHHGLEFKEVMDEYSRHLIELAEKLAELASENLGLEKDYLKRTFAPAFVGTKVAMYPQCLAPERVMGLRGHSDAGGIIMLLQDDAVPGLEFFKDGEWVPVPPTKGSRIFVNFGDQMEVVSNGAYRSVWHRVRADARGSRLSVATFYNPDGGAVIGPAPELVYPVVTAQEAIHVVALCSSSFLHHSKGKSKERLHQCIFFSLVQEGFPSNGWISPSCQLDDRPGRQVEPTEFRPAITLQLLMDMCHLLDTC